MTKRDNLVNKIEENKFNLGETENNIKNFIKLFILDESAKESGIKEESAKIIESTLSAVNEKERISLRISKRISGMKRLDSIYLD
jgi:hypothetical protein